MGTFALYIFENYYKNTDWRNYKMRVGIPKGLLYYKYHVFLETFFKELGAEIINSPDTNKQLLNLGIKSCTDEACLPVKVFHGHVEYLKDKCDLLVIPRIMQLRKREIICPKFCGLPEMILNSIEDLPPITMAPIYAYDKEKLYEWCDLVGSQVTKNVKLIRNAYEKAILAQNNEKCGFDDQGYKINIALIGHPYNLYDTFINMNIVKKLNALGVGIITEESLSENIIDMQVKKLFKKPFWTFARNSYGFSTYMALNKKIDVYNILLKYGAHFFLCVWNRFGSN